MRNTTTAIAAALAVLAAGAAPAMACWDYASTCGRGLYIAGDYHEGYARFEHLPDPTLPSYYPTGPRYYYVNQGPAYTGPGMYAPLLSYQERAVTGWHGYEHGYYYGYNGGPYGDAMSHYYDGMPAAEGPVVYRYGPWAHRRHVRHSLRYGYGARPTARYAHGPHIVRVPYGADRD
jgi:hypothetical protein